MSTYVSTYISTFMSTFTSTLKVCWLICWHIQRLQLVTWLQLDFVEMAEEDSIEKVRWVSNLNIQISVSLPTSCQAVSLLLNFLGFWVSEGSFECRTISCSTIYGRKGNLRLNISYFRHTFYFRPLETIKYLKIIPINECIFPYCMFYTLQQLL